MQLLLVIVIWDQAVQAGTEHTPQMLNGDCNRELGDENDGCIYKESAAHFMNAVRSSLLGFKLPRGSPSADTAGASNWKAGTILQRQRWLGNRLAHRALLPQQGTVLAQQAWQISLPQICWVRWRVMRHPANPERLTPDYDTARQPVWGKDQHLHQPHVTGVSQRTSRHGGPYRCDRKRQCGRKEVLQFPRNSF